MLSFKKRYLLPQIVFLITLGYFTFSANSAYSGTPEQERAALVARVTDLQKAVDRAFRQIENQSKVSHDDIAPTLKTLNQRIKVLAQEPEVQVFKRDLAISLKHQIPQKKAYYDFSAASCKCPKFKGWQCSEFGCGTENSWAGHCANTICYEDDRIICEFILLLPITGFLTLSQLVIEPVQPSKWDCLEITCPKLGCPLEANFNGISLRAYLTNLHDQLKSIVSYLNTGEVSVQIYVQPPAYDGYPSVPPAGEMMQ